MDIPQLERAQEAELRELEAAVSKAEAQIKGIDPQLKPEVAAQRAAALRDEAVKALGPRLKAMQDRADEARAQMRRHTPEAARRTANFHVDPGTNATMVIAAFTQLARTSSPELVEVLEDAVEAGNVAMAEAVRKEFAGRTDTDGLREAFVTRFAKLRTPAAEEATRALTRVAGLAEQGNVRMTALLRGRPADPMAVLAAHRAAGTPRAA